MPDTEADAAPSPLQRALREFESVAAERDAAYAERDRAREQAAMLLAAVRQMQSLGDAVVRAVEAGNAGR